jgi:hypothetical protein
VSGDYLYLADGDLSIIDLANPAAPQLAASLDIPYLAEDVVIAGAIAYVAADTNGALHAVDIGNPLEPVILSSNEEAASEQLALDGEQRLLTVDFYGGLTLVDVSDPQTLQVTGSLDIDAFRDVTTDGSYAYVASSDGLRVIDYVGLSAPVALGVADTSFNSHSVTVAGEFAYVGASGNGLYMVYVGDPATPAVIARLDTPGYAYDLVIDDYLYLADHDEGVQVIRLHP